MIRPEFGPPVVPTLAAVGPLCSWQWQPPGFSRTTCSSRTSKFVSAAMLIRNRPSVSRASRMSSRRKQTVCVGVVASPTIPSGAEAGEPSNHIVGPTSIDLARSYCLNCAHSETNFATPSLGMRDLQLVCRMKQSRARPVPSSCTLQARAPRHSRRGTGMRPLSWSRLCWGDGSISHSADRCQGRIPHLHPTPATYVSMPARAGDHPPILLTSIAHTPRPCVPMTSMRSRGCTMKSMTFTDGRLPPSTFHRAPPFVVTYTPKSLAA